MKILATSDLHGYLPPIPSCDLLILGGDYLASGDLAYQVQHEVPNLHHWLTGLQAHDIIMIGGNHDWFVKDRPTRLLGPLRWRYLQDQGIVLRGLKIYGSPWTPPFCDWTFMQTEEQLAQIYLNIPSGLDILVTHGPPYGILDQNSTGQHCGSHALLHRLHVVQPKVHIFGHIHEGYGQQQIGATKFYNVSRCDGRYRPINPVVEIQL